jgi:hypothetical protein
MYSLKICIFLFLLSVVFGCTDPTNICLKRISLTNNFDIDTIEKYPSHRILILNKIESFHLGNFTNNLIIQKNSAGEKTEYEIETEKGEWVRFSKDYIAFVKSYSTINRGWIKIKNGRMTFGLPGLDHVLDSLKNKNTKSYFLKETNGLISFMLNGHVVKSYNYGNFITKYKTLDFDSLDYKLYKLNGDSLDVVSNDANDINLQREGVFFIPPPGYNIIHLFSKKEVLNKIDSISRLSVKPDRISIKQVVLNIR